MLFCYGDMMISLREMDKRHYNEIIQVNVIQ